MLRLLLLLAAASLSAASVSTFAGTGEKGFAISTFVAKIMNRF